jgi:hypothetical protein
MHHRHLHLECLILLLMDLWNERLSECLYLLESLALLSVEHLTALDMAEVAHVANISECEVVVEASLASPVTNSLLDFLGDDGGGFSCTAWLFGLNGLNFFG